MVARDEQIHCAAYGVLKGRHFQGVASAAACVAELGLRRARRCSQHVHRSRGAPIAAAPSPACTAGGTGAQIRVAESETRKPRRISRHCAVEKGCGDLLALPGSLLRHQHHKGTHAKICIVGSASKEFPLVNCHCAIKRCEGTTSSGLGLCCVSSASQPKHVRSSGSETRISHMTRCRAVARGGGAPPAPAAGASAGP